MTPRLLLVAHGTRSAAGRREICRIALESRKSLAASGDGADVRLAWVDVQSPRPERVLADGAPTVVVPGFLACGYHVRQDVRIAVDTAPGATTMTEHLGAEPEMVRALVQRLAEAGGADADAVVLGAAGSRDPRSRTETEHLAVRLSAILGVPVMAAYASAAEPRVADAVRTLRGRGQGHRKIAVATHLLAPGFFASRLLDSGADVVSAPLGAHPEIVSLVLRRYRDAVRLGGPDAGLQRHRGV